jgi:SAM-dependent methyltransferase
VRSDGVDNDRLVVQNSLRINGHDIHVCDGEAIQRLFGGEQHRSDAGSYTRSNSAATRNSNLSVCTCSVSVPRSACAAWSKAAKHAGVAYTRVGDFLVGLIGLALLRSRVVELGDKEFCDGRIAELRRILDRWDDPALRADQFWQAAPAEEGYAAWASTYDADYNPLIDLDSSTLGSLLDAYPAGDALDAACGTGRWAAHLAQRGHHLIGVDESAEMLQAARAKLPELELRHGKLEALPIPTASVDLVVCSLALTHLPRLAPAFDEFARVLRPGGHAVISNIHHLSLPLGGVIQMHSATGRAIRLPASLFLPTDYITAALSSGFRIRSCAEIVWPEVVAGHGGPTAQAWCREAARAAYVGTPALMVLEVAR